MTIKRSLLTALAGVSLLGGVAVAQPAPAPTRIRGTIDRIDGDILSIKPRSGPDVSVRLNADARIVGVKKAELSDVQSGSYIGTATVPQPDGTARALEVTVFPPNLKGLGEGSYAYDLGGNSTMTNGTIGDLVVSSGRVMTVHYNGRGTGEKKIFVPEDVPIVLLDPTATRALLTVGAHVTVTPVKAADGSLTAGSIAVGENGLTPPM
ncbi:hypothetical protein [Roseomonas elaeocarpi]|uniref:DUF5666 domain-containing protein n=1 Tax=Roseomonas elaeocarpi TaxID=907779 RepID=A0ABV6JM78_9PROT